MTIRPARLSDFAHLETFVWQAIFPVFDVPGLTDLQRAENDALVEHAREEIAEVLGRDYYAIYVAIVPKTNALAGYIIADATPGAYAEIKRLIVKRAYRGKGVAELLLDEATYFIGKDRAVSLVVRHYNARAIAFFTKHGFMDTKETAGNYAIARTLMLREANTVSCVSSSEKTADRSSTFGADFPTEADEPVFEALPDYSLASDEMPLFETGVNALSTEDLSESEIEDSSLSNEQLSVLEAFIAKARAQKGRAKLPENSPPATPKAKPPTFDRSKIAFEIDYRENKPTAQESVHKKTSPPTPEQSAKPSFSFDFAPVTEEVPAETVMAPVGTPPPIPPHNVKASSKPAADTTAAPPTAIPLEEAPAKPSTNPCSECSTKLPTKARFCYVCGLPQPSPDKQESQESEPPEDSLELPELPADSVPQPESIAEAPQPPKQSLSLQDRKRPVVTTGELRKAFKSYCLDRITAYFGSRSLTKFTARLEDNSSFQQVRDGSLSSLATWLNDQPAGDLAKVRKQNNFADLTEYFIVETAGDLSANVLPQRLLRYQSVNWQTADLFKLVMDYLDFSVETETVHTDFVSMSARALKNATKSFLHAAKDERVFFICDQSLISQAKNGFAITDSGIYWKNILQPAGAATFTTMQAPKLEQGHLVIDGQFFDAGGSLNLKVAVLLDKLRRMR